MILCHGLIVLQVIRILKRITKQATWLKKEKNVQINQLKRILRKSKIFNLIPLSYMGINEPFVNRKF